MKTEAINKNGNGKYLKYLKTFYEPKLYNDHFQNYKVYGIPKAQLVIADIPEAGGDK